MFHATTSANVNLISTIVFWILSSPFVCVCDLPCSVGHFGQLSEMKKKWTRFKWWWFEQKQQSNQPANKQPHIMPFHCFFIGCYVCVAKLVGCRERVICEKATPSGRMSKHYIIMEAYFFNFMDHIRAALFSSLHMPTQRVIIDKVSWIHLPTASKRKSCANDIESATELNRFHYPMAWLLNVEHIILETWISH